MNILSQVISSIKHKKIKYLLLFLIFFLLGNFLVIGIGINDASKMAVIKSRQSLNPIIILEYATDGMPEDYGIFGDQVIVDAINVLEQDDKIKVYNKTRSIDLYPISVQAIEKEQTVETDVVTEFVNRVTVVGNNTNSMIEIEDDTYEIIEGRFYTQEEIDNNAKVILVTSQFAKENNLKIGDKIEFIGSEEYEDMKQYFTDDFDPIIEYEIIGLFENHSENSNDVYTENFATENLMLAPVTSFLNFEQNYRDAQSDYYDVIYGWENSGFLWTVEEDYMTKRPVIKLNDPDDLKSFVEKYEDSLLPYYKMNYNNELFESYGQPLEIVIYFSNLILIAIIVNMTLMFTAIISLFVKMRDNEIGILLSMGIKKIDIVLQIFIETMIIALLGISLALFTGSFIGEQYGNQVLSISVVSNSGLDNFSEQDYFQDNQKDYFSDINSDDVYNNFEVDITFSLAITIYIVMFLTVLISAVVPSLLIMSHEPNKILNRKE